MASIRLLLSAVRTGVHAECHALQGVVAYGDESIEEDELDKVEPDRDGEIEAETQPNPAENSSG